MRYSAVIFDLFGTLVPDIMGPLYQVVAEKMAKVLSVPADQFSELWFGTVYERNIGIFQTIEDNISHICKKLNTVVNELQVFQAAQIRYKYVQQTMNSPRKGALKTIVELRNKGVKTGLLSDCSSSEEEIWPITPFAALFDVTVFSSEVKLKKPDIKIFQLAANSLQVTVNECIYVGNGGSNEIEGADKSGMFPVLILPEDTTIPDLLPDKAIIEYAKEHGKVIYDLDEILKICV